MATLSVASTSPTSKADSISSQIANIASALDDTVSAVTGLVSDLMGAVDPVNIFRFSPPGTLPYLYCKSDLGTTLSNVKNDLEKALFRIESAAGEM